MISEPNDTIAHEMMPGISNRLTNGGTRVGVSRHAGGLGEGWSDVFAEWFEPKAAPVPDRMYCWNVSRCLLFLLLCLCGQLAERIADMLKAKGRDYDVSLQYEQEHQPLYLRVFKRIGRGSSHVEFLPSDSHPNAIF